MLIVCPSCATSYDIEPASLGPNGRQVRCVRCRTVWQVAPLSQAERLMAAADALAFEPDVPPPPAQVPIGAGAEENAFQFAAGIGGEAPLDQAADREAGEPNPLHAPAEDLDAPWTVDTAETSGEPFEIEAPSIAPVDLDAGAPPIDYDADYASVAPGPAQDDIESFAARFSRRRTKHGARQWSLSRLQTAILTLLIVDAVLVGWRKDIVRILPQTASLYSAMGLQVNVRGLSFDKVVSGIEVREGVPILVVQGNIVNDTGADVAVPRVKVEVRNAAKQEVYAWTVAPPQARLPAYQAASFRARLASPPPDGRDVLIRFLNRRDIVADTR
jgi:predicted Zn finger-like uncharacterized protein